MARSWQISVVVLVIFLAATVECAGTSVSNDIEMETTQQPVGTTINKTACRDRWIKYRKSYFSFCPCPEPYIINVIRRKCIEKGAKLAKSTSMAMDNFFLRSLKGYDYIVLGANDRDKEGVWRWPDGSFLNESYTRWHPGEPGGGYERNCMYLYQHWRAWFAVPCDWPLLSNAGFVCEKKSL